MNLDRPTAPVAAPRPRLARIVRDPRDPSRDYYQRVSEAHRRFLAGDLDIVQIGDQWEFLERQLA